MIHNFEMNLEEIEIVIVIATIFQFILSFFLTNIVLAACPGVLDHDLRILASKEVKNLCDYENKVVLAVNVASRCGYAYQYDALQNLYEEYKDEGLVVLGFPSNDFFQEFTEEEKVKDLTDG